MGKITIQTLKNFDLMSSPGFSDARLISLEEQAKEKIILDNKYQFYLDRKSGDIIEYLFIIMENEKMITFTSEFDFFNYLKTVPEIKIKYRKDKIKRLFK